MNKPVLIVYTTAVLFAFANADCHPGWKRFQNSCYLFATFNLTWFDASSSCQSHHADLVSVQTEEEQKFLQNTGQLYGKYFWLGARDDVIEGTWMWSADDSILDYTNWFPNEPNDALSNEDCLEMEISYGWKWNDVPCTTWSIKFICEKQLPDLGPGIIG